ncbi:MAG: tRNA (guanosine(37)-N1)-methyltransferase TrmD [Deltaproteobacteria bacterium CG11_big_fil_rev_8_21_14_0_20_47_16]|nr:MAG: tRNA (guanosine(37)-N1)-methyltransferase TrmD [Deltaproteobacteria bacterium CG11_big_fil_rev_8_21_14_0_20_47_16]
MLIDILTIFPEAFESPLSASIMKRAIEAGLVTIHRHNIRDHATDVHHKVDDTPYGGGAGMVMKADVLSHAVDAVPKKGKSLRVLLSAQGQAFNQAMAQELATYDQLILVCGHYEGVDERFVSSRIDREISIGDYVVTGGEVPALVVCEAVTRLLPGVLGNSESAQNDSHTTGLLEYPHYTRPAEFESQQVPEILMSGNHGAIKKWRRQQELKRTFERRSELLKRVELTQDDVSFLKTLGWKG